MTISVEKLPARMKAVCDACEKRRAVARIHGRWACFDLCETCRGALRPMLDDTPRATTAGGKP